MCSLLPSKMKRFELRRFFYPVRRVMACCQRHLPFYRQNDMAPARVLLVAGLSVASLSANAFVSPQSALIGCTSRPPGLDKARSSLQPLR